MMSVIKSEFQKSKRTSINKFVLVTPIFTILLSFLWYGGQSGAYNWWYIMFLPAMLSIISSQVITREEKISYKGMLLYPKDKRVMWLGKIIYVGILLVISSLIFTLGIESIKSVSQPRISLNANILAGIVLILTFLFQIPINLFLTLKFNMFLAIAFNIGMTLFGLSSFFIFYPYRITSILMVPILNILPNGLQAPTDSPLLNTTILLGIVIIILIFILITILTTIWFEKKEVN